MPDNQDNALWIVMERIFGRTRKGRRLLGFLLVFIIFGWLTLEFIKAKQPSSTPITQQQSVTVINPPASAGVKDAGVRGKPMSPLLPKKAVLRRLIISGMVRDEITGDFLDDVEIFVNGYSTTVSGNGYYRLVISERTGPYPISIGYKRPGYGENSRLVEWKDNVDTCNVILDVTLKNLNNEKHD